MGDTLNIIANREDRNVTCLFKKGDMVKIINDKYVGETGVVLGYAVLTNHYKLVALRMTNGFEEFGDLSNIVNSKGLSFKTEDNHGLLSDEGNLILI